MHNPHGLQVVAEPLEDRRMFAADLTVAVLAKLPFETIANQKIRGASAAVTVINSGDAQLTGSTSVELFLSADHLYDASDIPVLSSTAALKLKAGASKALKFAIATFPEVDPEAAPGGYHIVARVNGAGTLPEADLANNTGGDMNNHVVIQRPRLDLAGAFAVIPASAKLGKPATAVIKVANSGNILASGAVTISIRATTDTAANPTGTLLSSPIVKLKVKPSELKSVKVKFTVPAEFAPGTYFLRADIDETNVIAEGDETNNFTFSTVPLTIA